MVIKGNAFYFDEGAVIYYLGIVGSVILFVITGFHVYWLFGGKAGTDRCIQADRNGDRIKISKPVILATALVFFAAAVLPLAALGIVEIPLPRPLVDIGLVFGITAFSLRGLAGAVWSVTRRKPRDIFHRWNLILYTPICIVLAVSYCASYAVLNF